MKAVTLFVNDVSVYGGSVKRLHVTVHFRTAKGKLSPIVIGLTVVVKKDRRVDSVA